MSPRLARPCRRKLPPPTKRSSRQLRIRQGNERHRPKARRPRRPCLSCPDASCSSQYRAGALFPTWTPPRVRGDASRWVGRRHAIGASLPFRRSSCLESSAPRASDRRMSIAASGLLYLVAPAGVRLDAGADVKSAARSRAIGVTQALAVSLSASADRAFARSASHNNPRASRGRDKRRGRPRRQRPTDPPLWRRRRPPRSSR